MNRNIWILTVVLLLVAVSVQAQEELSTTRYGRQHKHSDFNMDKMKQTEQSLLAAIESESVGMQRSAIQAMRELEQLDPKYPFSSLITPLAEKLKNEKTDRIVRRLAALALDELHSDAGDAAVKAIAEHCDDKGLQTLCEALMIRSELK